MPSRSSRCLFLPVPNLREVALTALSLILCLVCPAIQAKEGWCPPLVRASFLDCGVAPEGFKVGVSAGQGGEALARKQGWTVERALHMGAT